MLRRLLGHELACRDFKLSHLTISRPRTYQSRNMATSKEAAVETNIQLPKLSAAHFQVYNHMAEHMEYYVSRGRLVSGRGD